MLTYPSTLIKSNFIFDLKQWDTDLLHVNQAGYKSWTHWLEPILAESYLGITEKSLLVVCFKANVKSSSSYALNIQSSQIQLLIGAAI